MIADSTSRVLQAIPPMSQGLKDWLQALAWLAAAAGFLLTVVKFWSEAKAGRLQRSQELRWRQAQAGKALNDEMQEDKFSWAAMQMLDSDGREFLLASGKKIEITLTILSVRWALIPA